MKGMCWTCVGALLMAVLIVGMIDIASHRAQQQPVFATQEATQPAQTETGLCYRADAACVCSVILERNRCVFGKRTSVT